MCTCTVGVCVELKPPFCTHATQGVLQTCSLGKWWSCWEQTQQDSTTNWLLVCGGTAGLIRQANSGEQGEWVGAGWGMLVVVRGLHLSLSQTHAYFHINTYFQTPPPLFLHPIGDLPRLLQMPANITCSSDKCRALIWTCFRAHLQVKRLMLLREKLQSWNYDDKSQSKKENYYWDRKFILDLENSENDNNKQTQ